MFSPQQQNKPSQSIKNIRKQLEKNPETAYSENLFRFVTKSALLPKIDAVNGNSDEVKLLQQAIREGDFNAEIFKTKDCYINLLYLVKNQKLDFWQGMTVYIYLIGLMQLTDQQALREEDIDVKLIKPDHPFNVVKMVENNKLTEKGSLYIKTFVTELTKLISTIPDYQSPFAGMDMTSYLEKELTKALLSMSPVDQWLFEVPYDNSGNPYDRLMTAVTVNTFAAVAVNSSPHLVVEKIDDAHNSCLVPSFAVLNAILAACFSHPLKCLPIFGSINENTLKELHAQGLHPIALYAPDVKSNIKLVHELRSGPVPAYIHDFGHVVWGSFLSKEAREAIFYNMVPKLEQLETKTANPNIKEEINAVKSDLMDFNDVTSFKKYIIGAFEDELPKDTIKSIKQIYDANQSKPLANIADKIILKYQEDVRVRINKAEALSKKQNM